MLARIVAGAVDGAPCHGSAHVDSTAHARPAVGREHPVVWRRWPLVRGLPFRAPEVQAVANAGAAAGDAARDLWSYFAD